MYGHPINYNPYGPNAPRPGVGPMGPPPTASATDVPLAQFRAAQSAGGSHLSADGRKVYQVRYGKVYEASWQDEEFGSWWPVEGDLPGDAVAIDKEQYER